MVLDFYKFVNSLNQTLNLFVINSKLITVASLELLISQSVYIEKYGLELNYEIV